MIAHVGLGSNLGDRRATLEAALRALAETADVRAISRYRETIPAGGPSGQGAFLNAAATLETDLGPVDLLRRLQDIERRAGRARGVRWGERTLDADLLIYGDAILDTPELSLPHPRLGVRRFVLGPLAEIAPEAVDPATGRTIADLLANLDRRPGVVLLSGLDAETREQVSSKAGDWVVQKIPDPAASPTFEARYGSRATCDRPLHPTLYFNAQRPATIAADIRAAMLAAHDPTPLG